MSEETKKSDAPTEVVRKLVVPEPPTKDKAGDRSPTKTERDLDGEVSAKVAATPAGGDVVRELVVPTPPSEPKEDDRSPTKTERDLDVDVIVKTKQNPTQTTETVRKLVMPEE